MKCVQIQYGIVELGLLRLSHIYFLQLYLIEDYGKILKEVQENVHFYQW